MCSKSNFVHQKKSLIIIHVYIFPSKHQDFRDLWYLLNGKGILEGKLVNHVWKEFDADDRSQFLKVMEQFDLICVAPSPKEDDKSQKPYSEYPESKSHAPLPIQHRRYYVPSLFKPKNIKHESDLAYWASLTFFVDLNGLFTSEKSF